MFSQASVCSRGGGIPVNKFKRVSSNDRQMSVGGWVSQVPCLEEEGGYPRSHVRFGGGYPRSHVWGRGGYPWGDREIPYNHYPWCIGPHHTTTHGLPPPPRIWDLDVQGPTIPPPFRTCSNLFIMKRIRLASRRLASYWNAFLLGVCLHYFSAGKRWERRSKKKTWWY